MRYISSRGVIFEKEIIYPNYNNVIIPYIFFIKFVLRINKIFRKRD